MSLNIGKKMSQIIDMDGSDIFWGCPVIDMDMQGSKTINIQQPIIINEPYTVVVSMTGKWIIDSMNNLVIV